jgi:hypothetical protein
MLRHMDAAWEICGGKHVLGLMVVEGQGGAVAYPDLLLLEEIVQGATRVVRAH